ncbi:hypothetical protein [Paenibacillus turpanensis]|uniref:hypothetical protein n=1 Tax=Paenibacillus turpanensis TaxID=2689078 RepID=UPI00140CBD5F|nr:hypothetical protein [Paenibacillus turpanensis]
METRTQKNERKRREIRKMILVGPKLLISIGLTFFIYLLSMVLWVRALNGTELMGVLAPIITVNIAAIGFFIMVGSGHLRFFAYFTKSFFKILFTAWVVVIIQFSVVDKLTQNVWVLFSVFFFVYFEVLLELNDFFLNVREVNVRWKWLSFINNDFINSNSIVLSIITLAVINAGISYFIEDLIKTINL